MISLAFGADQPGAEGWLRSAGLQHMRVLREGSGSAARAAACLLRVPMAQFFGGQSVPMTGIAGVAVPPENRGQGHALEMMTAAVQEIAADGTALSGLYASTQTLYRQVGYEQGGHCFRIRLPLGSLHIKERSLGVRPVHDGDDAAIHAGYAQFATGFDGMLDRGEYVWRRVREWRDHAYTGWCVVRESSDASAAGTHQAGQAASLAGTADESIEGYVFLRQERKDTGKHDLLISDIAFTTPAAGRRLLGFLSDFATMGEDAVISQAGSIHPLLTLLPTQKYAVERREYWMTRITNLPAAIAARGFAPGVRSRITIEVTDEQVAANHGRWTIEVNGGRGTISRERAGSAARSRKTRPALRCTIGGLVPLYTGLYSPRQAVLCGLVEGDAATLDAAGAVFAAGSPWMADFF